MASILYRRLLPQSMRPSHEVCRSCRNFTSTSPWSSGHNRWSTIRHDKAKNDKAKSRERQLIGKEISNATQMWGPDTQYNPRLALILTNAKRAGIPKNVIEAALARGQGKSVTGQPLESIMIEATLPFSVAVMIDCQTDQKARILQDVRHAIKNGNGKVTPTSFMFEKKGRIIFEKKDGLNLDDYLDQVIEAGATDVTADEEGRLIVFTEWADIKTVGEALTPLIDLKIEELGVIYDPKTETMVDLQDEEQAIHIERILYRIRDQPGVQDVYMNTVQKF